MKLINAVFDPHTMDDSLRTKCGRLRNYAPKRIFAPGSYLDFEESEIELDRTIGKTYYNERTYQPRKQSIRVRWGRGKNPMIDWWDERPGGAGTTPWGTIWNKLYGHINKYIGKKFDDCYSDFVRKIKENKDFDLQAVGFQTDGDRCRPWVERFFEVFGSDCRFPSDYYVDESGIIHKRPTKPRRVRRRPAEKIKRIDRSAEFDRSLWIQKHENRTSEFGFHATLNNPVEHLRWDRCIDILDEMWSNSEEWGIAFGCSKAGVKDAIRELMQSPWMDRICRQDTSFVEYDIHRHIRNIIENQ